jgi:glutathione S-transferase
MHSPSGTVHIVTGEFKELRPNERLVYTWGWLEGPGRGQETLVTVTLTPKDGGTDLTLEQSGFATEQSRDAHAHGWTSSFNSLDNVLAGRPKQPEAGPVVMGDGRSSYVQSVRIALAEKGIAYRHEVLPPQSSEILAVNPFGKIPVLRAGDLVLFESSAIMHYINDAYPGPALLPEDRVQRAKAEQWTSALNCYAYPAIIRDYVLQYIFPKGADGQPDREEIESAQPEIRKILLALDRGYGTSDYLAGDRPSIADITLAPMLRYLTLFPEGKEQFASVPNVKRAHSKFIERASFAGAIPETARS